VPQALRAYKEHKAGLGPLAYRVVKEPLVHKAFKARKAHKAALDSRAHKEHKEPKETRDAC
jgi:hypothetical protein